MSVGRRRHLREREIKQISTEISRTLKLNISDMVDKRMRVEVVELTLKGEIILMDDKPSFIRLEDEVFPTLINEAVLTKLPSITVDRGAIPHICNGADLMAPGVVKINGDFDAGDLLVIVEERFSKGIAIAKALYTSTETAKKKVGKVAMNRHFVGDSFWKAFKLL